MKYSLTSLALIQALFFCLFSMQAETVTLPGSVPPSASAAVAADTHVSNIPQAFASDSMVKGLVLEGIQKGDDLSLFPIRRAFFYLPLQYAEDPYMQTLSIQKYQLLADQAPKNMRTQMQQFLHYAQSNQQIIARFGRFPYCNAILGRLSTPNEQQFLNQMGSGSQ